MNLIIVESPAKSRTLSHFLGEDYHIMASMGHLRDLPKKKLGVEIENNFRGTYIQVPGKEAVIADLKEAAKKATKVILATDPDREGEAIAYHIKKILEEVYKKKFSRIVFHEITKEAIFSALKEPREININLVDSQKTRRVLDRLVGYSLSPLLWRKIRRGLSAGRVQTPALRLIVEREREIEKFKPEEFWTVRVNLFKEKAKIIETILTRVEGKEAIVKSKKESDTVIFDLGKARFSVLTIKVKNLKRSPVPPFTTSTLQQSGSRLYNWSSKKTMREAQRLYESGFITYHRTDSLNLAISAINNARDYINSTYGKKYLPESPRFYKTQSKMAQEAHEAIRVTNVKRDPQKVKERLDFPAFRLYQLIFQRFLASQMADQEIEKISVDIEGKAKKNYLLKTSEEKELFAGWRRVYEEGQSPKRKTQGLLKDLKEKDSLKLDKIIPEQKFTEPPARFTEGTLVKALEEHGIGRPSTYAPIISTIQLRQYVEKTENGRLKPTAIGVAINDFIVAHFNDVVDYGFTANMEDDLDKIAQGKIKKLLVLGNFWKPFDKKVKEVTKTAKRVKIEVEKTGRKCPQCKKGEVVIRTGRFGRFYSCSRFPECKYTETYIEKIKGVKCPKCGGEIVVRFTRRRKRFFGCLNYPKCQWAAWKNPKGPEKKDK